MDELSMLRAARPQGAYPNERREAARDRLLAQATASARAGRHVPRPARAAWRISRPWQASLAAALTIGVTLGVSQAVQLRALALIPGTKVKVVTDARNAAGQPGIAVAITSPDPAQTGFLKEEIIFDSRTNQDIGGVLVQPDQYAKGGFITLSTTRVWQAYYNAAGHRL